MCEREFFFLLNLSTLFLYGNEIISFAVIKDQFSVLHCYSSNLCTLVYFAILSISRAIFELPVGRFSSSLCCHKKLVLDMIYAH